MISCRSFSIIVSKYREKRVSWMSLWFYRNPQDCDFKRTMCQCWTRAIPTLLTLRRWDKSRRNEYLRSFAGGNGCRIRKCLNEMLDEMEGLEERSLGIEAVRSQDPFIMKARGHKYIQLLPSQSPDPPYQQIPIPDPKSRPSPKDPKSQLSSLSPSPNPLSQQVPMPDPKSRPSLKNPKSQLSSTSPNPLSQQVPISDPKSRPSLKKPKTQFFGLGLTWQGWHNNHMGHPPLPHNF